MRGLIRAEQHKFAEAIGDLDEALRLAPHSLDPELHFARGRCWSRLGQPAKAIIDFDAAVKIDSKEPRYLHFRSQEHYKLKEYKLSLRDLNAALDINPDSPELALDKTDVLIAKGDDDIAIVELNHIINRVDGHADLNPLLAHALANRAAIVGGRGEFHEALADLHKSIELVPDEARSRVVLARILAGASDPQIRNGLVAMMHATKACELTNGTSGNALNCLAMAYAEKGDFASAVKYQEKASERRIRRRLMPPQYAPGLDPAPERVPRPGRLPLPPRQCPAQPIHIPA